MKPVSYQHSLRVHKAKFFNAVPKSLPKTARLTGWLSLFAGLILVILLHIQLANGLIALGLLLLAIGSWITADLGRTPVNFDENAAGIALDQLLSADIVARLNNNMSPQQLFEALKTNWQFQFLLLRYQLRPQDIEAQLSPNVADSAALWNRAFALAAKVPVHEISAGVILVALMQDNQAIDQLLEHQGMDMNDIAGGLLWEESLWQRVLRPKYHESFGGIGRDWASGFTPILDKYGRNISIGIQKGNQDFSSVTRGHVIEQIMTDLSKADRRNAVLIGEVGVGKTALVYALAEKLLKGGKDVPEALRYKQIVQIDPGIITASVSQKANLELIFTDIVKNATKAGNIILFFDEAQLFFGTQPGSVNVGSILLPILQASRLSFILAFTHQDWSQVSSLNPSLAQQFAPVEVGPADRDQTVAILQDISIAFETQAKHPITFKALQAAYDLADRYIHGKEMPSKAIDLLSDSLNYPDNGLITEQSVAHATEILTNTKVAEASAAEKSELLHLEDLIHKRMINQSRAVEVVSNALRRSRAGVRNPNRPVGSFLFLGPTGVGKTELTKSLAAVYFGSEKSMVRLDMSEYQNQSDVERLLQAASQTERGSSFLQQINQNPFSVVLLDEIEKAHPDILNLLLQMLDEGELTDSSGHQISFKEAIIICTSNAGANEIRAEIEAGKQLEQFEPALIDSLINQNVFKPELINRFDEIVLFRPLNKEELLQVADLIIVGVNQELEDKKVSITLTPAALQYLVDVGYDPRLGARPMRRVISRLVENLVAKKLLSGEVQKGAQLTLDVDDLQAVG